LIERLEVLLVHGLLILKFAMIQDPVTLMQVSCVADAVQK
jgi:uncharacterized protein YgbK (DUF1537 family)